MSRALSSKRRSPETFAELIRDMRKGTYSEAVMIEAAKAELSADEWADLRKRLGLDDVRLRRAFKRARDGKGDPADTGRLLFDLNVAVGGIPGK